MFDETNGMSRMCHHSAPYDIRSNLVCEMRMCGRHNRLMKLSSSATLMSIHHTISASQSKVRVAATSWSGGVCCCKLRHDKLFCCRVCTSCGGSTSLLGTAPGLSTLGDVAHGLVWGGEMGVMDTWMGVGVHWPRRDFNTPERLAKSLYPAPH